MCGAVIVNGGPKSGFTCIRGGDALLGDGGFGTFMIMNFAPSKLFHAVVITGAALTGCAGATQKPGPSDPSTAAKPTPAPTTPSASNGTCPPGSERPFPPCYWIK